MNGSVSIAEENSMNTKLTLTGLLLLGLAMNPLAYASDEEGTMNVVEDGQTELDVLEYVALEAPNDNAVFGTDVANMARDPDGLSGREFGDWVSEQVRQDVHQEAVREARAGARPEIEVPGRPE
jgi:hypothetical protein